MQRKLVPSNNLININNLIYKTPRGQDWYRSFGGAALFHDFSKFY